MQGFVFYQGPSLFDGRPIVAIATIKSKNAKTGPMIQTWILRSRISPIRAISNGGDESICGTCPKRGHMAGGMQRGRECYVRVDHAPLAIYRAYRRGRYPRFNAAEHAHLITGRKIRQVGEQLGSREVMCPASEEAGRRLTTSTDSEFASSPD